MYETNTTHDDTMSDSMLERREKQKERMAGVRMNVGLSILSGQEEAGVVVVTLALTFNGLCCI